MSRRDTIILAVLINVGLLTILFITANHKEEVQVIKQQEPIPQLVEMQVEEAPVKQDMKTIVPAEEVDDVLNKLARQQGSKVMKDAVVESSQEVKLPDQGYVEVTVKNGDYLARIAKMNGTTVEEIVEANNLKGTQLKIGQVLRIPVTPDVVKETAEGDKNDDQTTYYTVRSGDNPWLIAVRHHIPLEELLNLNNLDQDKARHLKPGDKIRVK